ncbi:MAG: hypothetical protein P1P87_06695 [Trueperaceae bacterium]|nr:hypothetical protein [Trueperaceae bacterium]
MSGAGGMDGEARARWKAWSALGMVALAGLVVLLVVGFPASGSRPLAPALVPYVGWPFGIASSGVDRAVVGAACGTALALGLATLRGRRA